MKKEYIKYNHYGFDVVVRSDLKGAHKDNCLCFDCDRFFINDPQKKCKKANMLYAFCCLTGMTTPVFECPDFCEKL